MDRQRQTHRAEQPSSVVAEQVQQQTSRAGSCSRRVVSWGGWGLQHGRGFSRVCSSPGLAGAGDRGGSAVVHR
jgi:hypothetical protein